MARFNAAIMDGAQDAKFQNRYNYLLDLLDEAYIVEKRIDGKSSRVEVSPQNGLLISYDGESLFSISPTTGEVIIGKYDDAIVDSVSDAKDDLAQQLGYADYAEMVAEATLGKTIISGGYLRTSLIEAHAILTSKLLIGNFDNLVENSGIENGVTGYSGISGTVFNTSSDAHSGNYSLQINSGSALLRVQTLNPIEVVPGEKYYVSIWYKSIGGANGQATCPVVYYYDKDDTYVSSDGTNVNTAGSWTQKSAVYTIPANIKYMRIVLQVLATSTQGAWLFDDIYVRRAVSGELVVDGKITSVDGSTHFDLDTPELVQTAEIDGKDVRVEVSPTNPFKLAIEGAGGNMQDFIYVTGASGFSGPNILVTSKYDVNEDGKVDWQDLKLVRDYIFSVAGSYPPKSRMDVNDDGNVDSNDLLLIYQNMQNADRVTTSLGLQAGMASSGFWLSSDWGTTKQYQPNQTPRSSASSGASGASNWLKVAEFVFSSRYTYVASKILIMGSPSTAGVGYGVTLYFTAIQQNAFASNPLGNLYIMDCITVGTGNVAAIITEASADQSVVEVYVQSVHTYKSVTSALINDVGSASKSYTQGTWQASLPAGTAMTVTKVD